MTTNRSIDDVRGEQEIRALELEARTHSIAGKTEAFERVANEDFIAIDPRGAILTRGQSLNQRKAKEVTFRSINAENEQVRLYGNAAVITGLAHVTGHVRGQPIDGDYRYARVYIKREGKWRIVLSQSTPVRAQRKPQVSPKSSK